MIGGIFDSIRRKLDKQDQLCLYYMLKNYLFCELEYINYKEDRQQKIIDRLSRKIQRLKNESKELKTSIMDETTNHCTKCFLNTRCSEDSCVIYRIERIVSDE